MADADYEILEQSFRRCIRRSAQVERLYTGCRWAEGPVYFPLHRSLVWSDIPKHNRLYICATTSLYAVLLPVNGAA